MSGETVSSTEQVDTLGYALPREMARVRDEVLPAYLELQGTPGVIVEFAIHGIRQALDDAAKAMVAGDVVAMLRAYETLQGVE